MLMPKRVKRRKQFRGRMTGKALRGNKVTYGDYGIQATEPGWITGNQIEAARIAINRYIKRGGKVWIKIFPDKPVTEKPAETRMGSGKGSPEYWVAVVKPGRVLFELSGVDEVTAREAMRLAQHKLSVKTKFILREKGSGTRAIFENIMKDNQIDYQVQWESASTSAIIEAVSHNLGLGFVSIRSAAKYAAEGSIHIFTLNEQKLQRYFFTSTNINHPITSQITDWTNFLNTLPRDYQG